MGWSVARVDERLFSDVGDDSLKVSYRPRKTINAGHHYGVTWR